MIQPGTVAHMMATLLLATEDLSSESEMMFPPRGNAYRTIRLQELSRLAWDCAEAVLEEKERREKYVEPDKKTLKDLKIGQSGNMKGNRNG
jgi:hypothetical protein